MDRLYGKILRNKIDQAIKHKIGEDQAGITAERSCLNQIYTLEQLLERQKQKSRYHIAFYDLKKASDSVRFVDTNEIFIGATSTNRRHKDPI